MKQIGLAFAQYMQDYDERVPPVVRNIPSDVTWDTEIRPYLGIQVLLANGSPLILKCPSDTLMRRGGDCSIQPNQSPRTYAMTSSSTKQVGLTNDGRLISSIPAASETILLVESPNIFNRAAVNGRASVNGPTPQMEQIVGNAASTCPGIAYGVDAPLHFESWNYLFVDGHVKWLNPESTISTPGKSPGSITSPKALWTVDDTD